MNDNHKVCSSPSGELWRFARSLPTWRSLRFMLMWWERSATATSP